ncbi:hypothetical protein B2G71_14330 [Novosphingobium sp. PC22D]|uniref:response regulator n=1 Tax=Novosphingobium sp. PC22D TaxID=1962403 RepID=UPI000BF0979B|nr:response regulator transcription factor [Novosphingobium sp. PC22D]PEQ11954.1 hypothetical protein B2G71_14330 [Novosphingobium sp. PC22D]
MTSVVIADDHAFFRSGLESALCSAGYDVVASVSDGEGALDAVARTSPDVVILDVRMPGMDGISTLEKLRRQGCKGEVIMLAAEFEDHALMGAIRAGANAIVNKNGAENRLFDALTAVRKGGRFIDSDYLERFIEISKNESMPAGGPKMSERERFIADNVAQGFRNREIAEKLGVSEALVKLYLHRLYTRLGIKNRTELAIMMRELA